MSLLDYALLSKISKKIDGLSVQKNSVSESLTLVGEDIRSPYYDTINKRVYAIRETGRIEEQGLVKSDDFGENWQHVYRHPEITGAYYRNMFVTSKGTILLWASNYRLLRLDNNNHQLTHTFADMYHPLLSTNAIDEDENGTIMYAEYGNVATKIWKSVDDGMSWEIAHEDTAVRHWHGVRYDPYTGDWYAFAGDTNAQSRIVRTVDGGETWETLAQGIQDFRTCGLQFSEDYIYWCPDFPGTAPGENKFLKIHRDPLTSDWAENMVTVSNSIEGPAYGILKATDGRFCFWTAAENREMSAVYLSDGNTVEKIMQTNRYPNTEILLSGFAQITHADDDNVVFIETNDSGYGKGYKLFVMKLPTLL